MGKKFEVLLHKIVVRWSICDDYFLEQNLSIVKQVGVTANIADFLFLSLKQNYNVGIASIWRSLIFYIFCLLIDGF